MINNKLSQDDKEFSEHLKSNLEFSLDSFSKFEPEYKQEIYEKISEELLKNNIQTEKNKKELGNINGMSNIIKNYEGLKYKEKVKIVTGKDLQSKNQHDIG